jgi:hypothetical protein
VETDIGGKGNDTLLVETGIGVKGIGLLLVETGITHKGVCTTGTLFLFAR